MSHAYATVTFDDDAEFHAEYNGTSGRARSSLFATHDEVTGQWRETDDRECTCGQPDEAVEYFADYGGGVSFQTRACRRCMALTGPRREVLPDDPRGPWGVG